MFLDILFAWLFYVDSLITKKDKPFFLSLFINAHICDQPVEPGCEFRVKAKLIYAGKEPEKNLLRNVLCRSFVGAKMEGDGIDPILVRLKQLAKSVAITLLTGFYYALIDL